MPNDETNAFLEARKINRDIVTFDDMDTAALDPRVKNIVTPEHREKIDDLLAAVTPTDKAEEQHIVMLMKETTRALEDNKTVGWQKDAIQTLRNAAAVSPQHSDMIEELLVATEPPKEMQPGVRVAGQSLNGRTLQVDESPAVERTSREAGISSAQTRA